MIMNLLIRVKEANVSAVLDEVLKFINKNQNLPDSIQMYPSEFIDFCYFTNQIVNKPTLLGIPVKLYFEEVPEDEKFGKKVK
jgi:hypothetical protein